MKILFILFFSLVCNTLYAQHNVVAQAVNKLEKSQFYFVGQGHNNKANIIIEQELLFALNQKFGVRYDILEYAHSAAVIINQYLKTGDRSLLNSINASANFSFIRAVKKYNDTTTSEQKIKFYGLDFEDRNQGKYVKKAFEIIKQETDLPQNNVLTSLINDLTNSTYQNLAEQLQNIKYHLAENETEARRLLGAHYLDALLISNAQFFNAANRDKAMLANFKSLYNELDRNELRPSFFASFGYVHLNPKNRRGLALKLMKSSKSPVRNNVCLIGIQYFNCQFNHKRKVNKRATGNLNYTCRYSLNNIQSDLQSNQNESIQFLTYNEIDQLNCNQSNDYFSGLFIVQNFGRARFWTWE